MSLQTHAGQGQLQRNKPRSRIRKFPDKVFQFAVRHYHIFCRILRPKKIMSPMAVELSCSAYNISDLRARKASFDLMVLGFSISRPFSECSTFPDKSIFTPHVQHPLFRFSFSLPTSIRPSRLLYRRRIQPPSSPETTESFHVATVQSIFTFFFIFFFKYKEGLRHKTSFEQYQQF